VASSEPTVLPEMPRPAAQAPRPGPDATRLRNTAFAGAGLIAVAAFFAVVATHVGGPSEDQETVSATHLSHLARTPPTFAPPTFALPTYIPSTLQMFTPPPDTHPPAPVSPGSLLPPGTGVRMRGDSGEEMTIIVDRIYNPAPRIDPDNPSGPQLTPRLGYRLVSVGVSVENTGGVPFLDDLEKYSSLVDRAGHTYPHNATMTSARQLHPASRLDPESSNGRVVLFEVKGSVDLARFRLSLHPGIAGQTQDWSLI
jgi:hypothetical protein